MRTQILLATAAVALLASSANAALTTYATRGLFDTAVGPTTTETFNSCGTGTVSLGNDFSLSSSNLGPCGSIAAGISFTPVPGYDLYIAGPGQSANIDTALGVDFPPSGYDRIDFSSPTFVFATDLFQNYGGGSQSGSDAPFTVAIYGSAGLLGSYTFGVASGTGGFFGVSSTDLITRIEVSQDSGFAVIDNVSFIGTTVPEPAIWGLMLAGFGLVGGAMRRRTAVAA